MPDQPDRIEVLNVTSPHHVTRVDRAKYMAMRTALMAVLPGGRLECPRPRRRRRC